MAYALDQPGDDHGTQHERSRTRQPDEGDGRDIKIETISGSFFDAARNVAVAVVAPKKATPMGRLAR